MGSKKSFPHICTCNEVVLEADTKYADRAKEKARQIPRPLAFTCKLACIHCPSDKTTLVICLMLDLRTLSIWLRIALPR